MSYPDWESAGLPPSPLLEGNERQAISMRVSFQPERGPPMDRQGSTVPNYLMPWNHDLSASQKVVFETFFHTTLRGGSGRFTATDPYTGVSCVMKFEGDYVLNKIRDDLFMLASMVRRVS